MPEPIYSITMLQRMLIDLEAPRGAIILVPPKLWETIFERMQHRDDAVDGYGDLLFDKWYLRKNLSGNRPEKRLSVQITVTPEMFMEEHA